jgi:hypothetical protein
MTTFAKPLIAEAIRSSSVATITSSSKRDRLTDSTTH